MSDWLAQYTAALQARDKREQAHKPYIDAYTNLADKTAIAAQRAQVSIPSPKPQSPPGKATAKDIASLSTDAVVALRADLASTQKARAALTATLKDVEAQVSQLQAERKDSAVQIAILTKAKLDNERKLRDRDEELRGKARLVEHAQDEMVSLGLQLHMAEERAEKLTKENKDLIDRWMKRMGEEAEKVNRDSRWA